MRKILFFTSFLLCSTIVLSQGFPNNQSVSNASTLYHSKGGLKADVGFVNTRYPDTATANLTYIAHEPGGQIVVGDIVYVRNTTTTKWIEIGSGSVIVNGDTTYVQLPLYVDTAGNIRTLKIFRPDGYEGGIVTYAGTGFNFNVSPITLYLHNNVYQFPATTLTLLPPNSEPRYDIFGVDSSGAFVKMGDSAALPIEPQVGSDSFALTKAFLISPGDTVPSNIALTLIYDEHVGSEYTVGYEGAASILDWDNTDNPKHGSKSMFISSYHNGATWYFYDPTYTRITPAADQVITGWVYLNGATTNDFAMFLSDSNVSTTNYIMLSDYGIDRNNPNVYQQFSIPVTDFNFYRTGKYTTVEIQAVGSDTSGAGGLYLDYIQLQRGLYNIPSVTDYSNKQDSNVVRNDSLFWVAKGIEHFVGKMGGCDTCISTITQNADSTLMIFIRANGDTAKVVDWTGGGSGSSITLQTNGVNNGSQNVLNLKNGTNTTVVDDGSGGISINATGSTGVSSVTGNPTGLVDNTDPANPIIQQDALKANQQALIDTAANIRASIPASIDTASLSDRINLKLNISDTASMLSPYVRGVVAGTNTTVDNTNPQYPVVSATGGGSITSYDSTITATSSQTVFTFSSFPSSASYISVFINSCAIDNSYYTYDAATQTLTFTSGTVDGDKIRLHIIE